VFTLSHSATFFFPSNIRFFGNCLFVRVMDTRHAVPPVWTQPTRRYDGLKFTSSAIVFLYSKTIRNSWTLKTVCPSVSPIFFRVWFHPFWRID
jgi:hypothetical protein